MDFDEPQSFGLKDTLGLSNYALLSAWFQANKIVSD